MTDTPTLLLVGASRGLGLAIAEEFAKRGWSVVGTVRGEGRTALHELAERYPGRIEIERLDVTDAGQISALRERLDGRRFDILFVNAGVASSDRDETAGSAETDEFVRLMVTNALAPMRVIERLDNLVEPDGLIGIMSSGLGSVANNETGGFDVYRGTKAAVNTYMRSYAARRNATDRALLLLAPGWIRTEMGGADAPFGIEETIPDIVGTIIAKRERPGLEYLDRFGGTVPW
ncbi:MAG: SDR family oxidoreductase [Novosphingobium sp.]|nr:SDR family oxidoreductase [Novosphingobium sp.]MBO9600992.1 SDR family oxidoreductase [Novosphingobium sp.]